MLVRRQRVEEENKNLISLLQTNAHAQYGDIGLSILKNVQGVGGGGGGAIEMFSSQLSGDVDDAAERPERPPPLSDQENLQLPRRKHQDFDV